MQTNKFLNLCVNPPGFLVQKISRRGLILLTPLKILWNLLLVEPERAGNYLRSSSTSALVLVKRLSPLFWTCTCKGSKSTFFMLFISTADFTINLKRLNKFHYGCLITVSVKCLQCFKTNINFWRDWTKQSPKGL